VIHIIAICEAYSEIRDRIQLEIEDSCRNILPLSSINEILEFPKLFTQFIVDCTSPNLPFRIPTCDELFKTVLSLSRDLCSDILKQQALKLKQLSNND